MWVGIFEPLAYILHRPFGVEYIAALFLCLDNPLVGPICTVFSPAHRNHESFGYCIRNPPNISSRWDSGSKMTPNPYRWSGENRTIKRLKARRIRLGRKQYESSLQWHCLGERRQLLELLSQGKPPFSIIHDAYEERWT